MSSPLFKADLHVHTTASDGEVEPKQLLKRAKESGLQGLALTDHDTISFTFALQKEAELLDITLIPGIELSTSYKDVPVHILGYAFHPDSTELLALTEKHTKRRTERMQEMIEALNKEGFSVSYKELLAMFATPPQQLGRPHLARLLYQKKIVETPQEAFSRFLGEGKRCYVPSKTPSLEETIATIQKASGIAVLAHPHLLPNLSFFHTLLEFPFDGVEGYYARFALYRNRPYIKAAEKRGLIVTGGSDFHGSLRYEQPLGCAWTPQPTFLHLKRHFDANIS